jgi:hypothetical protein
VFSNRDRVNEEPLSKITPVIQRYAMPPFVPGERNPDRISSTQALKRTSYARFREIINLYAAAFGRA